MANNSKKYVSLTRLQTFLDNLKTTFSSVGHKHKTSDLTDYTVDSSLSSTSSNPVQNKVLDAEFEAIATGMNALETAIDGKANTSHTHTISNVTNLQSTLDSKVPTSRTINSKPLSANVTLSASDVGAAPSSHSHDDRYYTETEIDTKLSGKANSTHTHTIANVTNLQSVLDGKSNTSHSHTTHSQSTMSNTDLNTIKTAGWYYGYTGMTNAPVQTIAVMEVLVYSPDWIVQRFIVVNGAEYIRHWHSGTTWSDWKTNVDSGNIGSQSVASATKATQDGNGKIISSTYETKTDATSKLTEAKAYADNAANAVKNDLLNNAGAAYDTLKELGDLIDDNKDAIDALEDIAAGKANSVHTHAISDVTNLQSALDGKANSSHGTHVSYSTTAPVMDGTAAVGTASTVARSDHKHPTDTSRAAKTDFDNHTANTTVHITSTERSNWNTAATTASSAQTKANSAYALAEGKVDSLSDLGITATATELNKLDGVTATTAELNYIDGVTSNIQTQLDSKQASITGGATTIASSNLTASRALVSNSSGKVAVSAVTSTELGYLDGVTSSIQTQLNGKSTATNLVNGSVSGSLRSTGASTTIGTGAFAVGYGTTASGNYSFAEGYNTTAEAKYAHAEGNDTTASGYNSHAEGERTVASLASAHAEGTETTASGGSAHSEGQGTTASGSSSHAEGFTTTASGSYSHAEGGDTLASGSGSHAEGFGTIAKGSYQHVQGTYNVEDTNNKYAHIVGKGKTATSRSNAYTLDWNGNAWFAGNIYTGGTSQSSGSTMLASISTLTTAEYTALEQAEATNANTLYMLTDAEEEEEVLITTDDIDTICGATV